MKDIYEVLRLKRDRSIETAARDDEQGVLILSRFTGAARDLRDAVLVNPYDIERTADAIRYALEKSRLRRFQQGIAGIRMPY